MLRPNQKLKYLVVIIALFLITACSDTSPSAPQPDTTVYYNAQIITVNDEQPLADAMAVRNGHILAVGTKEEVERAAGELVDTKNMHGKTIIPGFIDAHGHFSYTGGLMDMANLQPEPAGPVGSIDDVQRILSDHITKNPEDSWILGWGYDDSLLAEQRHPTRYDLDAISTELPIFINHVSGHLTVCNSKCLEIAGITSDTENPAGGIIRKDATTGEPDGVLEETASALVRPFVPTTDAGAALARLGTLQNYYAAYGVTTVQDGGLNINAIETLLAADKNDLLYLDVVGFLRLTNGATLNETFKANVNYQNHFRIGGVKLVLDGSPQGKTAWLTKPYHVVPAGQPEEYIGYPIFEDAEVERLIEQSFERNIPVMAHANGDAAADQLIRIVSKVNNTLGTADRRTVMIHAQTARDDQIDQMKAQNIIPSYFVAHTFYWGDWHRDSVFGEERASRISPLRSTIDRGVPFTTHNDTPVVPSDMLQLMWSAVNRITRSGKTLGPDQRIEAIDALKSVTLNAAYQMFEEDRKGSIEVGKVADLVVLSHNPVTIDPLKIKDIEILETIKAGKTVYELAN